jgi:hypothetical protein
MKMTAAAVHRGDQVANLTFDPGCQELLRGADALLDHFGGIDFLDITPLMDELETIGAQLPRSVGGPLRDRLERRVEHIAQKLEAIASVTALIHAELLAEVELTTPKRH